jgi:hypothetical protein
LAVTKSTKKQIDNQRELTNKIKQSIEEYIGEKNSSNNTVGIGNSFCEWVLYNIFELREDEVIDAIEISGKFDNGIDAVFEYKGELCILQSKYNSSHSIDAMIRFLSDCQRVVIEPPLSDRDSVQKLCTHIRQSYENKENINCYYVTNNTISEWEAIQKNTALKNIKEEFNNLKFYYFDFENIQEEIDIKRGALPKEAREKEITLYLGKYFDEFNTIVAMVKLKDFAEFVAKGGNNLFHSNIRNYLKSTKINQGIKSTLKEEPNNFWYFNNGVTIVCDEYWEERGSVRIKAPQIVNGCQTAKTLAEHFKNKTIKELSQMNQDGHLLIKIIRTKKSAEENEKKQLRDKITRYTNSQNAVLGLDFYALDAFQRDKKLEFRQLGYYYEIQRGAFITEALSEQKFFKGHDDYNYLLDPVKNSKKFVLPAKEVIQSFTAAIRKMPNVAYGRANELTPLGSQWSKIINEEAKKLPIEHFLFPFLVLKYAKEELKYKAGPNDFRKNSAFLFVSTYYLLLLTIVNKVKNKTYEYPEEVKFDLYKTIFKNKEINKELLKTTHKILKAFFRETLIIEEVGDNLRGFLQNKVHKDKNWDALKLKIDQTIDDLEDEGLYMDIEKIINNIDL